MYYLTANCEIKLYIKRSWCNRAVSVIVFLNTKIDLRSHVVIIDLYVDSRSAKASSWQRQRVEITGAKTEINDGLIGFRRIHHVTGS